MKDIIKRFIRASVGLVIAGLGIYIMMQANIGLSPWDALNEGIANITGRSFGTISLIVGFIVIGIDILFKERIGFGTILDAVIVGRSADFFKYLDFIPLQTNIFTGILLMIVGMFVLSFAIYFYMSAALCSGPRDMLLVAIGKRFKKVPIGYVNIALLSVVVAFGFAIGAPIGIGTIISVFGLGITMQIVFKMMKYEPRNTVHDDIIQVTKEIASRLASGKKPINFGHA